MDTLLLATKLSIPPSRHVMRRERLVGALEHGVASHKLILLSAPAGYGKTTLLADWAQASQFPVAWLSVSLEDSVLDRFLCYLVAVWERSSQV
jgi:LuxR family maltose regulon positive regulatory protein